jgi:Asp-tRNA(Asn)/Glu-tRNA(Gln) amidotransferase A subunit family amidase
VFNAIYGPDGIDQTVVSYPFSYDARMNVKSLKVGYLKSSFEKDYAMKESDSLSLQKIKDLGFELIPIELPDLPVAAISFILSAEAATAFDDLTLSNKDDQLVRQIRNAWPNVFRASRFIPAVEYIQANRLRYQLIQEMHKVMQQVDVYIAPSFDMNLLLTNLTGHPCVVLPNGFNKNNSPVSISFMGRLYQEGKLLAFADRYQRATDFHTQHPEGF